MHLLLFSVEGRAATWKNVAFFCKVNGSKKEVSVTGTDRIQTIIESSKRRSDALHEDLASRLLAEKHLEVLFYRDCVSMYTSKSDIKTQETPE